MNILFIGDIVGRPGRRVLFGNIKSLREQFQADLVIVNVENAAGGFGITEKITGEIFEHGADVLTSGNHIWDKKEALDFIYHEPRLLRPHNYPEGTPGTGWFIAKTQTGHKVGVLNVLGTVFMNPTLDCPFRCVNAVLTTKPDTVTTVIVDFHAEATSEKMAMGWHLDGRVSAVIGTHSHVPTADERILPGGTAFISDAGMTGCYDSIIGMDKEKALARFLARLPFRFEVAEGKGTLCGVAIAIDDHTGKSTSIERIKVVEE